jgi:hypothetical protein
VISTRNNLFGRGTSSAGSATLFSAKLLLNSTFWPNSRPLYRVPRPARHSTQPTRSPKAAPQRFSFYQRQTLLHQHHQQKINRKGPLFHTVCTNQDLCWTNPTKASVGTPNVPSSPPKRYKTVSLLSEPLQKCFIFQSFSFYYIHTVGFILLLVFFGSRAFLQDKQCTVKLMSQATFSHKRRSQI